ncbi:MAG: response regulator, partial [Psychrosphaera sp.]|nr:response regulator [Psychrosphaera sp.]
HRNDSYSLSNTRVYVIVEDDKGLLWLGTHGGGLNKLDPKTMQFSQFRESDGLSNDIVYGIALDPQGLLWISTDNGLSRFDPDKISFKNYDFNDGLQGNGFNPRAFFKAKDGELFFGGSNGFNRFYPQDINDDPHHPTVVLTDFLVANQSVAINPDSPNSYNNSADETNATTTDDNPASFKLPQSIDSLKHLTLGHHQNLITFEFSALHFANQMKNQFAYQLLGQDPNWITTDAKNRRATYSNLAPGHYTLRIKASNKDGYWNEQGKTLSIEVLPPWWRSTLAYVLYIFSILTTSYSFYHYRTGSLIRRAKELERSVEERTATVKQLMEQKDRMFANISHEFKTPLTLILNPMDAIDGNQSKQTIMDKVSMMKRNGNRLLRLVEQLLELSKIKSGSTEDQQQWQYYSLAQTLNVLLTSFGPLFDSSQIKVKCAKFDDVVLHLKPDSLELILTNLISNAVKYNSTNGTISIDVQRQGSQVKIIIEDTGIGIDEKNQSLVFNRFTRAIEQHGKNIPGAGIGLALVKELALANHGQVQLTSVVGQGSAFTVTLPVDDSGTVELKSMDELPNTTKMEIQSFADDKASETTPRHRMAPEPNPDDNKPQLLIIDDNTDMLQLLDDTLNPHSHCIFADNGTQGVIMAKEHLPDLVLSDIMMPCISGFEVLSQLKTDEMTAHIPVILLTAKGDVQSRIKGWENQADEYLEKPFYAPEMLARIDNLLSIRQLLSHRFQQNFSGLNNSTMVTQQTDNNVNGDENTEGNQIDKMSQDFFYKLEKVLKQHYKDEELDVSILAGAMAMSRRQLSRKVKSMLDMTLTEAIRAFRLKKAIDLLKDGMTPSLVANEVGFSSHSYFSQCFKAHFGCAPSEHGSVG